MRLVRPRAAPLAFAVVLLVSLSAVVLNTPSLWGESAGVAAPVTPEIGRLLFSDFLAAFEIIALLLVASLVAAVYVAKPDEERREEVQDAIESKPRVEAGAAEGSMDLDLGPTDAETDEGTEPDQTRVGTETETGVEEDRADDRAGAETETETEPEEGAEDGSERDEKDEGNEEVDG